MPLVRAYLGNRWGTLRECLSMCRWIVKTTWAGRSCAIVVMNEGGPMSVVCAHRVQDLSAMTRELADMTYNMHIRFTGHAPPTR